MTKSLDDLPVAGFVAQEVDFSALFDRLSVNARTTINDAVITPAVDAERFPSNGQFCSVTVLGHSDRVDTPGLTSEQRRAQELGASLDRAKSAANWVWEQITLGLTNAGVIPPATLPLAQNFDIAIAPCGAADLIHTVPAGEAERAENRRVQFLVSSFT